MGPSALVSLLSVSSAVALSACARSSPATVSRRVVATPRAPPQSSPRSGITLDQAPTADPIDLGTVDGRATLWLVAGTRWLVDEHGATSAPHMLDPELVGGVRDARGWLFADETGSLWRSSETLGDMEPAGELTTEPFRPAPSRDVFAWIGPTRPGALYVRRGSEPARLVLDAPVSSASFSSERHGHAVLDLGQVLLTVDGGRTWRRVYWASGLASVRPRGDRWLLRQSGGATVAIARDGVTAEPGPRDETPFGHAGPAGACSPNAGRCARVEGRAAVLRDGEGRSERVDGALPTEGCWLLRWGDGLAATCPAGEEDGEPLHGLYRSDDGRVFRAVRAAPEGDAVVDPGNGDVVLGRDGRSGRGGPRRAARSCSTRRSAIARRSRGRTTTDCATSSGRGCS